MGIQQPYRHLSRRRINRKKKKKKKCRSKRRRKRRRTRSKEQPGILEIPTDEDSDTAVLNEETSPGDQEPSANVKPAEGVKQTAGTELETESMGANADPIAKEMEAEGVEEERAEERDEEATEMSIPTQED